MIKLKASAMNGSLEDREFFLCAIRRELPGVYVLLQTCNRVELYYEDGVPSTKFASPVNLIEKDVFIHLCSVASGLSSSLIGETQIQQQVRAAYSEAKSRGALSSSLHYLFQQALRISKLVRATTGISRGAMSHSHAAVQVIQSYNVDISKVRVTIIGVNNLNRSLLLFLKKTGASTIFIGNRNYDKACVLAEELGCFAFHLDSLSEVLKSTDILVSATSAPHFVVAKEKFPASKKMLILDLAVPRDIDPAIGNYEYVTLLNLENIERRVDQNLDKRRLEIARARAIIDFEADRIFNSGVNNEYQRYKQEFQLSTLAS